MIKLTYGEALDFLLSLEHCVIRTYEPEKCPEMKNGANLSREIGSKYFVLTMPFPRLKECVIKAAELIKNLFRPYELDDPADLVAPADEFDSDDDFAPDKAKVPCDAATSTEDKPNTFTSIY